MENAGICFPVFQVLVRQFFQLSRSSIYWQLSWQISSGRFLQKSALIVLSNISRKAVRHEVLMFPEDCSKHTGMSLISAFNICSGVILCILKSE